MKNPSASSPIGLILLLSLLLATPAVAQMRSGSFFSYAPEPEDIWSIELGSHSNTFRPIWLRLHIVQPPEGALFYPPLFDDAPTDDGAAPPPSAQPFSVLLPLEIQLGLPGQDVPIAMPEYELPRGIPGLPDFRDTPTRPSNPVPEPSAALLFGAGAVVAGRVARRSRASGETR